MSIARQMVAQARANALPGGHPRDPVIASWFGGGRNTAAGVTVNTDKVAALTTVYRCVNLLSCVYAALPLHLYQRLNARDRERAVNVPAYRVLHLKANERQTSFEWRRLAMAQLLLRGNHYSYKDYDGRGELAGLIPLLPDNTRPFLAPNGKIAYEYQDPETHEFRVYLQDEIMHLKGFSLGGLTGVDPITFHAETFGLSLATREYGSRYFANGTVTTGVLETEHELADEAYARIKRNWQERHQGLENAHRPVILESGLKWNKLNVDSKQSQMLEALNWNRAELANIFGVPGHLVNSKESTSNWGAGIQEQNIGLLIYTLQPLLTDSEQRMTCSLLDESRFKDYFIEFNIDGLLRGDTKARAEFYRVMFELGAINSNEIRARENMNSRPDGDTYYVALNMGDSSGGDAGEGEDEDTRHMRLVYKSTWPATRGEAPEDPRFIAFHRAMMKRQASIIASYECRYLERALEYSGEKLTSQVKQFLEKHSEFITKQLEPVAGGMTQPINERILHSTTELINAALEADDPEQAVRSLIEDWRENRANRIVATASMAALDGISEQGEAA